MTPMEVADSLQNESQRISSDVLSYLRTNAPKLAFSTTLFYSLSIVSQRLFGLVSLHGGRPRALISISGACATAFGLGATHTATELMISEAYFSSSKYHKSASASLSSSSYSSSGWFGSYWLFGGGSPKADLRDLRAKTLESMTLFILIEHKMFRTMLPSSVIKIGVFANTSLSEYRSVPSSSERATQSERNKIQVLGKKYGCHHCGSKMIFSPGPFICDHMPPTKQAEKMNKAWWRRLLGMKVAQRLWPQCQSCFLMQGSAVAANIHKRAYFNRLRLVHFVPALSLLLSDMDIRIDDMF
jgi:hypothetical protein